MCYSSWEIIKKSCYEEFKQDLSDFGEDFGLRSDYKLKVQQASNDNPIDINQYTILPTSSFLLEIVARNFPATFPAKFRRQF